MTTPGETDFNCKASIGTENSSGGVDVAMNMVDLNIIFHPLQEGSSKAQATDCFVKIGGVDTDLNEIFEPLSSGLKIPTDTKILVGTTDLRDIFAGKDTIPTGSVLEQLPRGEFTCDTYLSIYYDRSGSMETAFGYITPAIEAIRDWFSKTLYGDTAAGRALAQQYVKIVNPAWPVEKCMCWIANGGLAGVVDSRSAGREVSIAYINESDPAPPWGGTGHKGRDFQYPQCTDSSAKYGARWKALTNAGGCKHGAIMGVWHPDFRGYPAQIDREINEVVFEGKALKDMGVSAFFGIYNNTPASQHVGIIANWLNIPTKPADLTITVTSVESDEHEDKVQWKFSSEICGLTHIQGDASVAFTKTQKCWKIEVKDENGLIVDTVTDLAMRPETHTYNTTEDQQEMTDFYCRLTAVGMPGYADTYNERRSSSTAGGGTGTGGGGGGGSGGGSGSGEWILCNKIEVIPLPTSLKSNSGGNYATESWTLKIGHADRGYGHCWPEHFRFVRQDVSLPAIIPVPASGSTPFATLYVPAHAGSGNPAATLEEWQRWFAYDNDVSSKNPSGWLKGRGRTQTQRRSMVFASTAVTFRCGMIGWGRAIWTTRGYGTAYAPTVSEFKQTIDYNSMIAAITLSIDYTGTVISSNPALFDPNTLPYHKDFG